MKRVMCIPCGLMVMFLFSLAAVAESAAKEKPQTMFGLMTESAKQQEEPTPVPTEQVENRETPKRASVEISTIAVAEFEGKNVSQADASIIADFMRTELVNTLTFKLVEKANMDKLLAEAAFQQTGCSAADCAVKMGKILNVKYMLVGSLSKLLDAYYITANLVAVETGEIVSSFNQEAHSAKELKTGCKVLASKIAGKEAPAPESIQEQKSTENNYNNTTDEDYSSPRIRRAMKKRALSK